VVTFWVTVLAISVLLYVLLDGFDLGVGILFGLAHSETRRHAMLRATAPISDGNETWLVVTGVILWGAFPVVYGTFGTPGVAKHAVPLETPAQAARFNRRLVNACIRAQTQNDPVRPGQLHVAIVGASATGAELGAELHRSAREVVTYGLDRIDPERDIRIVLIKAADRILPGLPERISEASSRCSV
jgi:hypothetical protein